MSDHAPPPLEVDDEEAAMLLAELGGDEALTQDHDHPYEAADDPDAEFKAPTQ